MRALILLAFVLLAGCSSARVMIECRELGQGFFECKEP